MLIVMPFHFTQIRLQRMRVFYYRDMYLTVAKEDALKILSFINETDDDFGPDNQLIVLINNTLVGIISYMFVVGLRRTPNPVGKSTEVRIRQKNQPDILRKM